MAKYGPIEYIYTNINLISEKMKGKYYTKHNYYGIVLLPNIPN